MLVIDMGNSCLKWAVSDNNKFVQQGVECYQSVDMNDFLDKVFYAVPVQQKIYISCVADKKIKNEIDRWFKKNWQINAVFVVSRVQQSGLINAYHEAEKLGVDRWYAMIGAWLKYKKAFCIIDCGTAVTMDLVDNSGQHLGGLIMPGLALMRTALMQGTAGIGGEQGGISLLANNTGDAVNSGCYQLLASGLESIFNNYQDMLGHELLCVITGGDGNDLARQFKCDFIYEPDVILYGLQEAEMAELM